jgi:hypothetical protein
MLKLNKANNAFEAFIDFAPQIRPEKTACEDLNSDKLVLVKTGMHSGMTNAE